MLETTTWDAIIVGAGPAGCAAAYDLVQAGRSVLIVDKAEFPRPKACAGGLTMRAYSALRYPVTDIVRTVVREVVLESNGDAPAANRALPVRRQSPLCVMTVREELDAYCLARTLKTGAQFLAISAIEAIAESDVITLTLANGVRLKARYLVGADGVHSRVRALTQPNANWTRRGFAIEANVWLNGAAPPPLTFDFAAVPGGYGWLFPRNDHVNVGLYVYDATQRHSLNKATLAHYIEQRCGGQPAFGVTGQYLGFGAAAGFSAANNPGAARQSRVLLVGDAGGFADPLTGEGIYGAIVSGQAAATAILRALREGAPAGESFGRATARLRRDLGVAASAAGSFYSAPHRAFRLLRYAPVRQAAIQTFSFGSSITAMAWGARWLARLLPERSSPSSGKSA